MWLTGFDWITWDIFLLLLLPFNWPLYYKNFFFFKNTVSTSQLPTGLSICWNLTNNSSNMQYKTNQYSVKWLFSVISPNTSWYCDYCHFCRYTLTFINNACILTSSILHYLFNWVTIVISFILMIYRATMHKEYFTFKPRKYVKWLN